MTGSTESKSSMKTLVAFILVAGLGAFAVWDGTRVKKEEEKKEKDRLLVPFKADEITQVELTNNKNARIELQKVPGAENPGSPTNVGNWIMTEPLKDQADNLAIQSLLTGVQNEKAHETVVEGPDIQWSVYGLDHPVNTMKVTAGNKSVMVQIGSVKAYDSDLYARVDQQNRVLLVGSSWAALMSKLPREYRDKHLLRGRESMAVNRIEIDAPASGHEAAEHLYLSQKDHQWSVEKGSAAESSEALSELPILTYLEQIKSARALDFLDDDKDAPGILKKNGLAPPALTIRLYPAEAPNSPSPTPATVVADSSHPPGAVKNKEENKTATGDSPTKPQAPVVLQFASFDKTKSSVAAVSSELKPVLGVYESFVEGLKKPVTEFFDKHAPFRFKVDDVNRIQIQTKGSLAETALDLELAKQGTKWIVATKGLQKEIDSGKLDEMVSRINDLEAVRFVRPLSGSGGHSWGDVKSQVSISKLPMPEKDGQKDGQKNAQSPGSKRESAKGLTQDLDKMSNHIRLLRADGTLVFELQWGDLLLEKKATKVSGEIPADLPGQVDAQFVATETSKSKWLLGVAEGSLKDLGIQIAIKDSVAALGGKKDPVGTPRPK